MQTARSSISYWKNWTPKGDSLPPVAVPQMPQVPKDAEGTPFGTFDTGTYDPLLVSRVSGQQPTLWQEDFTAWRRSTCALHPRCFSSVSSLYIGFCEWSLQQHLIACMRDTFELLLEVNGVATCDGLAAGLILKSDLAGLAKQYPVLRPGGQ